MHMALKNNYEGELRSIEDGYYYRCEGNNTVQRMAVADLENPEDVKKIKKLLPESVEVVYSDPPWNAGNRKYWRTHADEDHEGSWSQFLGVWTDLVGYCITSKGTQHVFTEQSYQDDDRKTFLEKVDETEEWTLPLSDKFKVFYGSPGSRSKQKPNMLLHFSNKELKTDPTGLDGEPMTTRACSGIDVDSGSTVFDPCMGKGMTSRMALYNEWNCIGTEINSKRLGKTITWLERKGYEITEKKISEVDNTSEFNSYEYDQKSLEEYHIDDEVSTFKHHPCTTPKLVHKTQIVSNEYNPNKVPDPELDLLKKSIERDGMTMPVVTYERDDDSYEIVDGFHRYLVLTDRLNEDWIPISVIDKDIEDRMSSTVRHNRARGDHKTELMGSLVESMQESGKSIEDIADDLGMEKEEIVRLKQVVGADEMLSSDHYSQSWGVQNE